MVHATADVAVIIPAAGSGQRLGGGVPKALRTVGGRTLLEHAVTSMTSHEAIAQVVLVVPAEAVPSLAADPPASPVPLRVVAGGASRQASVAQGLAAVDANCTIVLVHDAARPIVPQAMLARVIAAVRGGAQAVVPGLPVVDTIKRVDERGFVIETPPRQQLRAVQTPQGFTAAALRAGHAAAVDGDSATDDAALAERAGFEVLVVAGDPAAMKVTTAQDVERVERLLEQREES
jgi:2-C-methyl-D-erythritol 4-phosphate cytidylyltransferase